MKKWITLIAALLLIGLMVSLGSCTGDPAGTQFKNIKETPNVENTVEPTPSTENGDFGIVDLPEMPTDEEMEEYNRQIEEKYGEKIELTEEDRFEPTNETTDEPEPVVTPTPTPTQPVEKDVPPIDVAPPADTNETTPPQTSTPPQADNNTGSDLSQEELDKIAEIMGGKSTEGAEIVTGTGGSGGIGEQEAQDTIDSLGGFQ